MTVLQVDPKSSSTVYSGVTSDGRNRGNLYKSTDGGLTWNDISNGLTNKDVNAMAIDPASPSTLYVGTDKGLFKSSNGGQNWVAAYQPDSFLNLAIDLQNSSTLYASTYYSETGILSLNGRGNSRRRSNQSLELEGAIKSVGGGQRWVSINRGLPAGNHGTMELHLAVNKQTPATICASSDKGFFNSTDGGEHWSATGLQGVVNTLVFDPSNGATLYIGSSGNFGDAFVAKFNSTGSALIYSTYLGGSDVDFGGGIVLDQKGNVYVAGNTASKDFPLRNPVQSSFVGPHENIFVVKMTASASNSPKITSATVSGKKLIVSGEGFAVGAIILVNGKPQATSNDSQGLDTRLVSKKGGKKIKPGDSAMIQVQNPDGAKSSGYRFNRP